MKIEEFAENLFKFVNQAKAAGIPLEDIADELDNLKSDIESEIEEKESEDGEHEKDG